MSDSQKRILIAARSLRLGGIETSLISLLEYLATRDCSVDLVLEDRTGPLLSMIPPSVRVIQPERSRFFSRLQATRNGLHPQPIRQILAELPSVGSLRKLYGYIQFRSLDPTLKRAAGAGYPAPSGSYDLAIAYHYYGFAPRYVSQKVIAEESLVWFHHGEYNQVGWRKRDDLRHYRRFDKIVAVSNAARSALTEAFPSLAAKTVVVSNPINPSRILAMAEEAPLTQPTRDSLTLVTVSRLSWEKGLDLAIRGAANLRDRGVAFRWYFIGEGLALKDLTELVRDLALEEQCLFVGPRVNPFPDVLQADIYVQPSRVEAECLAVREAMVLGRPIVASDLPPIRHLLRNGHLGVLVQPEPDKIAEAIAQLSDAGARRVYVERLKGIPLAAHDGDTYDKLDALLGLSSRPVS